MPVNLSLIPDALSQPPKMNWWFWIIGLFVVAILGLVTVFSFSFFYSISTFWFVLYGIVLPVFGWFLILLGGIYYHGYQQGYAQEWNKQREERRQELIAYARRGMYVLDYKLITEYEDGNNANGVISGQFSVDSKQPYSGGKAIPHSALVLPSGVKAGEMEKRLYAIFTAWLSEFTLIEQHVKANKYLSVCLFIDADLHEKTLLHLWSSTFDRVLRPSDINVKSPDNSAQFLEQWLDNSDNDDKLLLVISARLFSKPHSHYAEYASLLLLAGQEIIDSGKIEAKQIKAKLYRTEQTGDKQTTIDNALLWAQETSTAYDGVWYSSVSTALNNDIMRYFDKIGCPIMTIFDIDLTIGNAGVCAYWLALALAIENTIETKNKQFVIVGKPTMTASVVTSIKENKEK